MWKGPINHSSLEEAQELGLKIYFTLAVVLPSQTSPNILVQPAQAAQVTILELKSQHGAGLIQILLVCCVLELECHKAGEQGLEAGQGTDTEGVTSPHLTTLRGELWAVRPTNRYEQQGTLM